MKTEETILNSLKIKFRKDVLIAPYTTTKVGGPAKYFVECKKEEGLVSVIKKLREKEIPYLLIGQGSNLLISDSGFDGVVILNRLSGFEITGNKIRVKSGNKLLDLVKLSGEKGLSGVEKLAGIPGTVGGAIYGNAGAYGLGTSDNLTRVKIFDGRKTCWLNKAGCGFSYRNSVFKKTKDVILEAEFAFKKSSKEKVKEKISEILKDRNRKYKKGIWCPGSFFKNVQIKDISPDILSKIPQDKIVFGKVPAGYLLESVNAKGLQKGRIKVSESHANFLINLGGGTAQDYYDLAMVLKDRVRDKFGVVLEPEVQIFGFESEYKGKKVAVLGLGIEGKDLVDYLLKAQAIVTIFDKKEKKDLDLSGINVKTVNLVLGKNYLTENKLDSFDYLFRSPGVYRYLPEIVQVEKKGIIVSSAIKEFFDMCQGKIIGVTGTKGKGTTATLIYEILKKSGKEVFLLGNIGKPYLEVLPQIDLRTWVILELSSFQLIDLGKSPNISVVLNITQDHMDWHKNKDEYVKAKENILLHQVNGNSAVINYDYQITRNFQRIVKGNVYYFSKERGVKGCFIEKGNIVLKTQDKKEVIGKTDNLLLRGKHNWENVSAAVMASFLAGADIESIRNSVFSFKGLEHRLEFVREVNGISFYNDSFATGPDPTIAAIKSFEEPITLILGGYDKKLEYEGLAREISKSKNLVNILLIGELEDKLFKLIGQSGFNGNLIKMGKPLMKDIVAKAYEITKEGSVVILSPAAASFDMFLNYKERGNKFKEAVFDSF